MTDMDISLACQPWEMDKAEKAEISRFYYINFYKKINLDI